MYTPNMKKTAVLFFLILSTISIYAQDIPRPQGYVNDFAGILDGGSRNEITSMIEGIEQSTGVEIAIATLTDLGGMPIDQLAIKYYESWGIGKKGQDNGVLILVAVNDRKAWIQTGYGIEGVLPDGLVGEIIRNEMLPRFKQGDYPGGIKATVYRVGKVVGGEPVNYPRQKRNRPQSSNWIFLVFIFFIIISMIGKGKRGGGGSSGSNLIWFLLGSGLGRSSSGWGGSSGGSGGFGGFGGFGGGSTGGGGAGGSW